jgi:hypothetical protein
MKKIITFFSVGIIIGITAIPLQGATITETNLLHLRDDLSIDVYQIWFNWEADSQAITLTGCDEEEMSLETPEFDRVEERNNPAAYVKETRFMVKVKFTSEFITTALIKATGSFGGFPETQVDFENGKSEWISFFLNEALPDYIKKHGVQWEWMYYDSNTDDWVSIGSTSHIIYALNREPLEDKVFENLTRWTTEWCEQLPVEDQEDDKKIADAIIDGFDSDGVIQYGGPGWDTAEILRTGDGMCGGMSFVFYDACATQGVKVTGLYFRLRDTSIQDPQVLWAGIVCQDPGIGRTEPGFGSKEMVWRWVNDTYPYPRYFETWDENDDVDSEFKRAYIFYKFDGHVVNLIDYNGEILLYDLSFGKGPYLNTFTAIPQQGIHISREMRNFRENYHDFAVDHMNGRIYYKNSAGDIVLDRTFLNVKTSIIPDEVDGKNQMLYYFDVFQYNRSKSKLKIINDDGEYQEFFRALGEKTSSFKITFEELTLIRKWLKNPSVEINWLVLRNAILKLGNAQGLFERFYGKIILNKVLRINTEINVPEECSLPGIMSPLNMVKAAASNSLANLEESNIKNNENIFKVWSIN